MLKNIFSFFAIFYAFWLFIFYRSYHHQLYKLFWRYNYNIMSLYQQKAQSQNTNLIQEDSNPYPQLSPYNKINQINYIPKQPEQPPQKNENQININIPEQKINNQAIPSSNNVSNNTNLDNNAQNNKNSRKLWQILKNKLNYQQDKQQYKQYLSSFINDNSPSSNHPATHTYQQIYFKITLIILIHQILYLNLLTLFSINILKLIQSSIFTSSNNIIHFAGIQFYQNLLKTTLNLINPFNFISNFISIVIQIVKIILEVLILIYTPFSIIKWKFIGYLGIFIVKIISNWVLLFGIFYLSFCRKKAQSNPLINDNNTSTNHNTVLNWLLNNKLSLFIFQLSLLLISYYIIGYLLSVLIIPTNIIKIISCLIFIINNQIPISTLNNYHQNNSLSILIIILYTAYPDHPHFFRILIVLILLRQCTMDDKVLVKTAQQPPPNCPKILRYLFPTRLVNLANKYNIKLVTLITMHIFLLTLNKQFKMLMILISALLIVKLIETLDKKNGIKKYKKLVQHKNQQQNQQKKQDINLPQLYDRQQHKSQNQQQKNVQFKDYRQFWDISLPFQQYH